MSTATSSLTVDVVDLTGASVGTIDLPAEWFDGSVNIGLMHEVVTAQLAAARQGTHKTKARGEVRGGGAKPWRQKGTGRARHGSIRSPLWVGGGVAHGRTPKNWAKRVNKKVRRAALRSALTDRAHNGAITVVRDFAFAQPRTKDAVAALAAIGHDDGKVLVVLAARDEATGKSLRNLQRVHVLTVDQLNTYDVLANDVVVIDEAAVAMMTAGSSSPAGAAADEDVAATTDATDESASDARDRATASDDKGADVVDSSSVDESASDARDRATASDDRGADVVDSSSDDQAASDARDRATASDDKGA